MVSQQIVDIIIKAQDQASSTANKVDESIQKIGKSTSRLSSIPGFDALKSKFSSVATTIDGKLGGALTKARAKFSSFKNSITSAASTVKSKLGGALDGIRAKLASVSNGAKGLASGMSFLKGAVSMTAGMIGYDLLNSLVETTRASLNARSGMQAFASRLNMSSTDVANYQKSLDELQNSYKKIDMDVVGQQATDMAYRLGLPKQSLTELTETTAIFTDAMQRNGRSAEDSMLAMSDAMDGQFTRLKEIGISQEDLMKNGWSGDINDKTGLLKAMNQALKELHYDDLAKSVDTLDDAWQVLSITLSNLLEAILLPLTPVIVQIVEGFTDAINAVKPFIQTLQNSAGALPEWLQDAGWAVLLAVGLGYIAQVIMLSVLPALAKATLAALEFAGAMLANPLTWVIIALAAVALAVYEVGKAFGWWTDVQSMLAAVWEGINRLWNAFINHPDVQAAISMISSALSTLGGWIQQAGQAVLEFFGISSSGNFDIVRALIDGVGNAWDTLKTIIMTVVGVFIAAGEAGNATADAFGNFWNGTLVPFGEWLSGIFAPVWHLIGDLINAVSPYITALSSAFSSFASGQMNLPTLIWTVLTTLFNAYVTIFSMIISRVASWGSSILARGVAAASSFVNGIVNRIRSLPGRVYSLLLGVVSRISSAIQAWINTAVSKVNSLISSIVSPFSGLAGQISSALSGVASALLKPFTDAWAWIEPYYNKIKSALSIVPGLGGGASGGDHPMGGETAVVSYGGFSVDSSPVVVEHNLNVSFDFKDVPSHISTEQLSKALTDRSVLRELTSNRDFQLLDGQAKERLNLKIRRANGA